MTTNRCPFCGEIPVTSPDYAGPNQVTAVCQTTACPMQGRIIALEIWNRRPIEAEYEADLRHCREVLIRDQVNLDQARNNWRVLRETMDNLLERS